MSDEGRKSHKDRSSKIQNSILRYDSLRIESTQDDQMINFFMGVVNKLPNQKIIKSPNRQIKK